jgi:hypothetical protein
MAQHIVNTRQGRFLVETREPSSMANPLEGVQQSDFAPNLDRAMGAFRSVFGSLGGVQVDGGPAGVGMMGDPIPDSKFGAGLALAGALPVGKIAKAAKRVVAPTVRSGREIHLFRQLASAQLRRFDPGEPGIGIETHPRDPSQKFAIYRDKSGTPKGYIGILTVADDLAPSAFVDESARRQGIATKLADALAAAGYDITRAQDVTPEGADFLNRYLDGKP